jgi:hypothetical protein
MLRMVAPPGNPTLSRGHKPSPGVCIHHRFRLEDPDKAAGEAAPSVVSLTDSVQAHGLRARLGALLFESQANSLWEGQGNHS